MNETRPHTARIPSPILPFSGSGVRNDDDGNIISCAVSGEPGFPRLYPDRRDVYGSCRETLIVEISNETLQTLSTWIRCARVYQHSIYGPLWITGNGSCPFLHCSRPSSFSRFLLLGLIHPPGGYVVHSESLSVAYHKMGIAFCLVSSERPWKRAQPVHASYTRSFC